MSKFQTKKRSGLMCFKRELPLHLMLVVPAIIVFIYSYIPILGLVMAFQKFNPVLSFEKSPFIGWDNFTFLFTMPNFVNVMRNTMVIAIFKIILRLLIPLFLALLINEVTKNAFKKLVQTAMFLPFFLSWAVLGGIVRELFSLHGPVNMIIQTISGSEEPTFFMASNFWFIVITVLTDVWKDMGYNMIIFLAAITSIDTSLYEAAAVDGCGKLKQMWHVTLPGMSPMIILLATLSIGSLLNAGFEQILILYNPLVYDWGDIIDTFVYRIGLIDGQMAPAAAAGLFKSGISVTLVGISYYMAYKFSDYRIF